MSSTSTPVRTPAETWARRAALPAVVVAALLVTVVVPLTFPADGGPTGFDRNLGEHIHSSLGGHPGLYAALVFPSNAYVVIPLLLAAAGWFAYQRLWWQAWFVLLAPEFTIALNSLVLKPLWDRPLHHYLAYPSGHTVHLVAVVTAVALVSESARVRVTIVVIMAVVLPAVLVGMVGKGYHHPTDVIGGAAAAIAVVTALYLPIRPRITRTRPLPR
ncbi:phosphatase PAP2 family protein [Nocardia yamanashiensis]|uniref:phosphatase PAP2 family protein n=1 Tax=Nocardia yamanashiensis TaxID=209247 RepID=UPI001E4C6D5E|nr:phosphatase PAP2 family protein [Nocardia yamanashiensis]UGT44496.1 phosphatase PAP2 family protein [Nocardia yamanashiensis]